MVVLVVVDDDNDVPPLYLFCVARPSLLTTRHNGDRGREKEKKRERERQSRRKDLDPALLEAALSFISSGRRVTDSESPCYSIVFCNTFNRHFTLLFDH